MNEKVTPVGGIKRFVSEQYLSDYNATTTKKGIVQLSDATNSTSTTQSATANAVKKTYDRANSAYSLAESKASASHTHTYSQISNVPSASTTLAGIVKLNDSVDDPIRDQAATANAVRIAFARGEEAYNLANGKADASHIHNAIPSRGRVSMETGIDGRPVVSGLSMSEAYNNGYPAQYGNVLTLKGTGDSQIVVGWSGSDGSHAPVFVRNKRDNVVTANWSDWGQFLISYNNQSIGGTFDKSTSMPNQSNRLNYNGYLYTTRTYGAVWNDYAECRQSKSLIEAGRVVVEQGDDYITLSTERMQTTGMIVSDTYGFSIGEQEVEGEHSLPIAVSGRVLAYIHHEDVDRLKIGDPLCTGPEGTLSIMTREEIINYPERIIATVSSFPSYEKWGTGDVEVNNRIWVKVR